MTQSPLISRIVTLPSLDGTWQVGLELDDGRMGWGVCVVAPAGTPQPHPPSPQTIPALIQQQITPLLINQPLTALPTLLTQLDTLTETLTITVKLPPPPTPPKKTVSRRALLLGNWTPKPPPEPRYENVEIERAIHPAGAYAISHAIQQLVSSEQGVAGSPPPPLWLDISQENLPINFYQPIAGWGFHIQNQSQVGEDGKTLQQRLRRLKEWLDKQASEGDKPTIFINLRGHFGTLFDDTGQVLGALVGLEQVSKPYPLVVIDPIILDDLASHVAAYKKLKSYMRIRRMPTKLFASAWVRQPSDLANFTPAGLDGIQLSPPDIGTLQLTQAIAQATTLPVIIAGDAQMANIPLTSPLIVPYQQAIPVYNTLSRNRKEKS